MDGYYLFNLDGIDYTYSHDDYIFIINQYRAGMSVNGITRKYAALRDLLSCQSKIIVEHAIMRYLERLSYWTKERIE